MNDNIVFAVPPIWLPVGGHQRLTGLSVVKTIAFTVDVQGIYIQALSQNVWMTLDGSTPTPSGNTTGFVLRSTDAPVLLTLAAGITIKVIQEAASAVLQYQFLNIAGRF